MKHKKGNLIIIYFIIVVILFMICSIFWYKETENLYEYDNFKESVIEDIRENPNEYKDRYNISSEEELTEEIINDIYVNSKPYRYVFILSASIPISIIGGLILFSPILFISSLFKKYRKYRLSIDDFKKNTGYYRDLLKDFNPLELSYNNNYVLDDNSFIAMILYLEKKKILILKDNKYFVDESKIDNLTEFEKEFINNIKIESTGIITISHSFITNLTDKSCKNKNLLVMDDIPKKKLVIDILKAISCYVILFIIWKNLNTIFDILPPIENTFVIFTIFGLFFVLVLFISFYPFMIITKYIILYVIISTKHSKRTNLGNEVNYKLDGLKNFIRDFSLLDEREKEEIKVWDDYLIYSVLFGDNKKIYDDMKDKVKYTI